ncbi:MAG: RNase adapter RapZ [Firmicutes bacterium]|nr:RNase adapter RapZ [Bacillota bacterium]
MDITIITGLSGAGKTKACDWFEDKGYYCIDNIPPTLIKNFIELSMTGKKKIQKAAFVVDVRGGAFFNDLKNVIAELKAMDDINVKIVFIEASDQVLIRRYNETRRMYPVINGPVTRDAIANEREILSEIREQADYIIDTSRTKVADFNAAMEKIFSQGKEKRTFVVNIFSFGFKNGIPTEADWVVDTRFIPNPFYVNSLKKLTGNNKKVESYVLRHSVTTTFINRYMEIMRIIIPHYIKEGKYSLTIAVGCTGGHHRSVVIANEFARLFREEGMRVTLEHRDL